VLPVAAEARLRTTLKAQSAQAARTGAATPEQLSALIKAA